MRLFSPKSHGKDAPWFKAISHALHVHRSTLRGDVLDDLHYSRKYVQSLVAPYPILIVEDPRQQKQGIVSIEIPDEEVTAFLLKWS